MIITFNKDDKIVTLDSEHVSDTNFNYAERFNSLLVPLAEKAKKILEGRVEDKYYTYYKKKSKGGHRRIDVPNEELKIFMKEVNDTFINKFNFIFPDFMYAYIHGRGIKQLAHLHKDADVIIKLDIKDFFNSCTLEFIISSMSQIYPFCLLDGELLIPILEACTLNGVLPQGAPTSPILSNIAMIPFGYRMRLKVEYIGKSEARNNNFSIYADDIIISLYCAGVKQYKPRIERVFKLIEEVLHDNTPLLIKDEKTKVVKMWKSNGIWITGLMVTKDHRVTIGHKEKQKFKALVFTFLADYRDGKIWDIKRVQQMVGKISFYNHIEPEYVSMIIDKYEKKTGQDYIISVESIIYS